MRRYQVCLAAIAGTLLLGRGAAAQGAQGSQGSWYISGGTGMVLPMDLSRPITIVNELGQRGPGTNTTTYTPGEIVNAAVGYRLPLGFRIEGELGYQHFLTDSVSPLSTNGMFPVTNGTRLVNPTGGAHNLFTSTVNLFYDLPFKFAGLTPYIGGGGGYYHASNGDATFIDRFGGTFTAHGANLNNATVLGEVGAAYPLTPNLSLVTSYRYEYFFRSTLSANVLKIGLRYSFGAAPAPLPPVAPAAVPAPAVAPARSFLVFFDWDKATLTDRARHIVADAAASATKVQYTRIEVNGYTDSSGTKRYNQGLSVRRAQAVGAELVRDGVPAGAISIQGFGETHPLVPTGPGVREPQNRRVEIVIR